MRLYAAAFALGGNLVIGLGWVSQFLAEEVAPARLVNEVHVFERFIHADIGRNKAECPPAAALV